MSPPQRGTICARSSHRVMRRSPLEVEPPQVTTNGGVVVWGDEGMLECKLRPSKLVKAQGFFGVQGCAFCEGSIARGSWGRTSLTRCTLFHADEALRLHLLRQA